MKPFVQDVKKWGFLVVSYSEEMNFFPTATKHNLKEFYWNFHDEEIFRHPHGEELFLS